MRRFASGNGLRMGNKEGVRMYYTEFDTDLCRIILAGDENGLRHLHLNTGKGAGAFIIYNDWVHNNEFFIEAIKQVNEYLKGKRMIFDLKLAPEGTEFQKRVWDELLKIPYGGICAYGEIARRVGRPKASQAVGAANSRNPIPLIIPCHRVIGSTGKLTGYAFGLDVKKRLLELESSCL
ncbi:MAG: methylated-DNA--[protein]-cysteine S-methyltransferase [Spirochaetales bacterium]|nr:methylated-DNA--[protein]-cysteine S-methyltransferase [Spirochaetales bacterium]